ncbi:MAG: hypothetical protein JW953_08980 [Anaerolineae bacterium]|nr:hypothetical protein [Anaerolineae bacterium]
MSKNILSYSPGNDNRITTQANLLKIAAVTIAIPRYAGAFALSAGFVAEGYLHTSLGISEVIAGVAMAVLEGFAIAFILNKWRLLKASSIAWYALLTVTSLLALSLPLVAIPYLYFMQNGFEAVRDVFPNIWLQNAWNFTVAFVPMLVVIGVGLADVNELEREQKQIDFELEASKKRAMLEMELSKLQLTVEQAKTANELEMRKLRAQYKVDISNVEARQEQKMSKGFICEHCGEAFEKQRQLNGHLAHCKVRANGHSKATELEQREGVG